jgi:hypothetical protein
MLSSIGGQGLNLPWRPNYTIQKYLFRLPSSMPSSRWYKGLNYIHGCTITLSDIIKNIHYQSLRCLRLRGIGGRFRLRGIGGQNLNLPWGPNYTIQKHLFRLSSSMPSSWWYKGLNCRVQRSEWDQVGL